MNSLREWHMEVDPIYLPELAKKLAEAGLALEYQGNEITDLTLTILNLSYNCCSDIETVLQEFAPYIKDESYIELRDDEDTIWRYAFYEGAFSEVFPVIEITWPMPWGGGEALPF